MAGLGDFGVSEAHHIALGSHLRDSMLAVVLAIASDANCHWINASRHIEACS